MQHLTANWRTSSIGLVLIILGSFESMTGLHIPGFTMDAGPAIAAGIGLLMAKDGAS